MLDTLGEDAAAARIDAGIRLAVSKMRSMRAGEMGYSTTEVGDLVAEGAAECVTRSTTRRSATARSAPACSSRSRTS